MPSLTVLGNSYRGIGIADSVSRARDAADDYARSLDSLGGYRKQALVAFSTNGTGETAKVAGEKAVQQPEPRAMASRPARKAAAAASGSE
jgi:hypothetical protein